MVLKMENVANADHVAYTGYVLVWFCRGGGGGSGTP